MSSDMQFHEAADIFPLMVDADFDGLVEDIREHGLREPIALLDGKIIDGRNRYRACLLAQVKPRYEDIETDDPIAYVISLNKHRRHLTPGQLAMVGDKAMECYSKQANERMIAGKGADGSGGRGHKKNPSADLREGLGRASDEVGKSLGISGRSVELAHRVRRYGVPELAKAVEEGRMAVSTAAILTTEPDDVQRTEATTPRRNRRYTSGPGGAGTPEQSAQSEPEVNGKPGVGVMRANEAINALRLIPKNDPLRKRGFQIVTDWIKANR